MSVEPPENQPQPPYPAAPSAPAAYPPAPYPPAPYPPAQDSPDQHTATGLRISRADVITVLVLVAAAAVVGILVGVAWAHWAPHRPLGYVVVKDGIIPDETESYISTDGRFAIFTAVVGLVLGIAAWLIRASRGPVVLVGLLGGGLLGALLTDVTGRLLGGGRATGAVDTVITTQLTVHAGQLLALEPLVAVLFYAMATLASDKADLGRTPALEGPPEPAPAWGAPPA